MPKRLLIAVGESASSADDLPFGVRQQILVVAPTLPTRFEWLASATDKRREQADARLGTVLGQLQELDSDAEGEVGADDPLLAFDDVRRDFEPDHVLISLRSQSG